MSSNIRFQKTNTIRDYSLFNWIPCQFKTQSRIKNRYANQFQSQTKTTTFTLELPCGSSNRVLSFIFQMATTTNSIRSTQLNKVTEKTLSVIKDASSGTFFRRHIATLNLDAGVPTSFISSKTSSSSTSPSTTSKRKRSTDEKQQIDDMSNSLLAEVTQRVNEDFTRFIDSSDIRSKLNILDELFVQQPQLPGGDGERVPAVLPENPTDLLRAKRMRLKVVDKEGLEQLLLDAQNVNTKLETDLARDRALLLRCENELERRAAMVDTAYSSLPKK